MKHQFIKEPIWSELQLKVLQSIPSKIISGCAGSGKTLLACHIAMQNSLEKKVAILVFTKSLRTLIKDYIGGFGIKSIDVLYEFEWRLRDFPKYDLIIVDEFQDFSLNDILNVISSAFDGVYLFGDIEQQLYKNNFKKEKTLSLEELITKTNIEHIKLSENFRISEENKNLIVSLYKSNSLKKSYFTTGFKPKILHFENVESELGWILDFLKSNTKFKSIGILLKQNDSFKGAYYYRRKLRKDKIYGVSEFQRFLSENNVNSSYKYKNYDNLDFTKEFNINILTYHSSKGLQFDCVILPFSSFINDYNGTPNLPYVGLTRASKQIIITYTGLIADNYTLLASNSNFEGKIIKKSKNDDLSEEQEIELLMIKKLINIPGYEYLKDKLDEIDININDCKIVKV